MVLKSKIELGLVYKRRGEYTNNHPWVGRETVKLLSGAQNEVQVTATKFIEILGFHLLDGLRFVAIRSPHAIPVKLAALPIEHLQGALSPYGIFQLI